MGSITSLLNLYVAIATRFPIQSAQILMQPFLLTDDASGLIQASVVKFKDFSRTSKSLSNSFQGLMQHTFAAPNKGKTILY